MSNGVVLVILLYRFSCTRATVNSWLPLQGMGAVLIRIDTVMMGQCYLCAITSAFSALV